MKLVIGNKNYSSWSLRPWLLLKAFNIPFDEVSISLGSDNVASEIARYNESGTVPVLHDKGLVVGDSLAICEYISEHYLHGNGWPKSYDARAVARSCSAEMHSGFFKIREKMPMNCRLDGAKITVASDLQQEITRVDQLWTSLRSSYEEKGPWLFGEFSIADCMFAPLVFRFKAYDVSSLSAESVAYKECVLSDRNVKYWQEQAVAEKNRIEMFEIIQ